MAETLRAVSPTMKEKCKLYTKVNGTDQIEYGYGPSWVAMAMFMDDFPRLLTEEEAIRYWNDELKKELKE